MHKFVDYIDWDEIPYIYKNNILSQEFVTKFTNEPFKKLNWELLSMYQIYDEKYSDEFLLENYEKINWKYICRYRKLNEKFILNCMNNPLLENKLDWEEILEYSELSENF